MVNIASFKPTISMLHLWCNDVMKTQKALLASVLLLISVGCAANETYVCPAKLTYKSAAVDVNNLPAGFEASVPANRVSYLTGMNVYDGNPSGEAALVPTYSSPKGNLDRWDFAGDFPQGKWLSCDYELGFVRIAKRVADAVTSCTATIRVLDKTQKSLEIRYECK